jgi:DNA-directed RNA polymerase specialized sigma24 family protein
MIGIAGGHEDVGQVIARARAGDEAAWTWLYDWLAPVLLGYLRSRGTPQPEDALSEVFLQVVRDIDTFDGSRPASAAGCSPSPTTG